MIEEARVAGRSRRELLVEQRLIDADQLSRAIAERYGLDHVDLNGYHVDMGAANLSRSPPRAATRRSRSATSTRTTLLVAIADPANVLAIDDIQMITGLNCQIAVAAADDIEALIEPPQLARERGHRGRRGGGGRASSARSPSCASRPTTRR